MVIKFEPEGDWGTFTVWKFCKCFTKRRLSFSPQNFRAVVWKVFTRLLAAAGNKETLGCGGDADSSESWL